MCNVLTAFKIHRDEFVTNGISTYAVHPGTMIGTGNFLDLTLFSTRICLQISLVASVFSEKSGISSQSHSQKVLLKALPQVSIVPPTPMLQKFLESSGSRAGTTRRVWTRTSRGTSVCRTSCGTTRRYWSRSGSRRRSPSRRSEKKRVQWQVTLECLPMTTPNF